MRRITAADARWLANAYTEDVLVTVEHIYEAVAAAAVQGQTSVTLTAAEMLSRPSVAYLNKLRPILGPAGDGYDLDVDPTADPPTLTVSWAQK